MSDIVKKSETELMDNTIRVNAQNFQSLLHRQPKPEEVRSNIHANNSKYLPISFLEMTLDELFFGLWQTKRFNTKVIANEIVGEIELEYFHPTHKLWITRVGAGAVQIQMLSEKKGGSGDITDIGQKIKNTLTKDYPHLKAECFRNACLGIGKAFGRDLNRDFEDQYKPLIKPDVDKNVEDAMNKILIGLDEYIGKNKEQIQKECAAKRKSGQFTMEFAEEIAKKIGLKL